MATATYKDIVEWVSDEVEWYLEEKGGDLGQALAYAIYEIDGRLYNHRHLTPLARVAVAMHALRANLSSYYQDAEMAAKFGWAVEPRAVEEMKDILAADDFENFQVDVEAVRGALNTYRKTAKLC